MQTVHEERSSCTLKATLMIVITTKVLRWLSASRRRNLFLGKSLSMPFYQQLSDLWVSHIPVKLEQLFFKQLLFTKRVLSQYNFVWGCMAVPSYLVQVAVAVAF